MNIEATRLALLSQDFQFKSLNYDIACIKYHVYLSRGLKAPAPCAALGMCDLDKK